MQNKLYSDLNQYVGLSQAGRILGLAPATLNHRLQSSCAPKYIIEDGRRKWMVGELLKWKWVELPRGRKRGIRG